MSSAPKQPKVLSHSKAWVYVALNQLAFPGAGTVMAGRRVGYIQATIMVAGFVLVMWYLFALIASVYNFAATAGMTEQQYRAQSERYAPAGKIGLALTVVAWLWSLVSSIMILRNAQKEPPILY